MMLYKVTSVAFDPDARKAYYTEDNYAFRDLMEIDVDTGKKRMLLQRCADRRHGRQSARTSRSGASATRTAMRRSSAFRRPMRASTRSTRSNMARSRSTSIFRPTGSMISASYGEIDGTQSVRVWKSTSFEEMAGPEEIARLDLPPSTPGGLHLRARRQVAVRHQLLHRRVERLPLRHRDPEI